MSRVTPFGLLCGLALVALLAFLLLPVVGIFTHVPPGDLLAALDDAGAQDALRLSLLTSLLALAAILAVGTPAAWLLARGRVPGRALWTTVVELPLVIPPAVAGIGLLAAFGPRGLLGGVLDDAGIRLVLETAGVVVALTFVASPFYVRAAQVAFAGVPRDQVDAARSLGSGEWSVFRHVGLPHARGALGAGAALAWGRAIGEFGATLLFAGSVRGVTQTAPLAIYERFGTDFTGALAISAVLIAVSGAILLLARLARGDDRSGGDW